MPASITVVAQADVVERSRHEGLEAYGRWQESRAAGGTVTTADPVKGPLPQFVLIDAAAVSDGDPANALPARIAADPAAIRRAVVQGVFGRSTVVACRCSLSVAFDPALVAAYRLVGYRQTVAESLAEGDVAAIDMHAGETARVVYEVARKVRGDDGRDGASKAGPLVSAAVTYWPPDAGFPRVARGVLPADAVDALAPLPSSHACEVLLAVGLGELAGGSVHVGDRRRRGEAVAALVREWRERGDVTPFGETLLKCLGGQNLSSREAGVPAARLTD